MNTHSIADLRPAGLDLLSASGSFLQDLTEQDEALITGGGRSNSNSNSGRRPKRRPARRRRARRGGNRSRSFSRT